MKGDERFTPSRLHKKKISKAGKELVGKLVFEPQRHSGTKEHKASLRLPPWLRGYSAADASRRRTKSLQPLTGEPANFGTACGTFAA